MLEGKSLTDLRGIAQAFGIKDIFQKDALQLRQAIEVKQLDLEPVQKVEVAQPPYDARLMTMVPADTLDQAMAEHYLAPYVENGLRVTYDEERWYMRNGKRTDEGTMRMPPRHLLDCARRIME